MRRLALVLCTLFGFVGASANLAISQQTDVANAVKRAKPVPTGQLFDLFVNRTWNWDDGGGFFQAAERKFVGWSGKGAEGNHASGVWYLPGRGRLCMRADWTGQYGTFKEVTCFEHREDETQIYQRKLPDGEWYVFAERDENGAFNNKSLVAGNRTTTQIARNEAYSRQHPTLTYPLKTPSQIPDLYIRSQQLPQKMVERYCDSPWILFNGPLCETNKN